MRRLLALAVLALATFLPGLLDAGLHVAKGFAAPDGTFRAEGEIRPDDGDGPPSAYDVALNADRLTFSASLGGPVDPESLSVALAWSATWFDEEGQEHPGAEGGLDGAATPLAIDPAHGVVGGGPGPEGQSTALSMARGPAQLGRPCGSGVAARAFHTIRFRRDGEAYTLRIEVHYTRRGHRIVTVDEGAAP